MIDVKKLRELSKETRHMAYVASEIGHAGAAEQFIECADAILALCDRLEAMEREREDQNRYLAAQSAEIAGLKQRLAQQPNYCDIHCKKFCQNSVHGMCDGPPEQQQSVEVMEKKILELADKYCIDYGGDYSRNAKEHEFDLLAFVRAVLSDPTQQPSGEVTDIELLNAMAPHLNDADGGYIVDYAAQSVVAAGRAAIAINAARTQGGESWPLPASKTTTSSRSS